MPRFSPSSYNKLKTCDPRLQKVFFKVIEEYDCTILEGHRSVARQLKLFLQGKSKVKFSNHNFKPSQAVDVAPYPIDWKDLNRFYHFAGYVKATAENLGVKLRWGGDWDGDKDFQDQSFNDLVHFELV